MSARDIHEICVQCTIVTDFRETKVEKDPFGAKFTVVLYSMYFANIFNTKRRFWSDFCSFEIRIGLGENAYLV